MDELLDFVNRDDDPRYDLIKIALAHHRFVWIHPFGNGNGRTVRLFTYALLLKYGFRVATADRIINPTAIFCNDRNSYYEHLIKADVGDEVGLEGWCEYVLGGLKTELEKVDRLSEYSFLSKRILYPMLDRALMQGVILREEYQILSKAIELQVLQSRDVQEFFPKASASSISKKIRLLLDRCLLIYHPKNKRKYILRLTQNDLTQFIIFTLRREGFLEGLI